MNSRELLALLTVKIQRFSVAPGGVPKYTPEDIAHALAMVKSPPARLYGRVKYADQTEFASELCTELLYYCSHIEGFTTWKVRPGNLQAVCSLALYEAINPHICPWCHGRCQTLIEGRVIICDGCRGSGRRYLTDTDRAKLVGMSKQSWSEYWSEKYKQIQDFPNKWEDIVSQALAKRLKG